MTLTKTEEKQLERCLTIAKQAGVLKDQAERFVSAGYIPLPWQWRFHASAREADRENGPVLIGCGGARGPGKSHAVLSQIGLDDCQRVAGLKVLFLRQTGKSAKESFEDLIEKALKGKTQYVYKAGSLRFPNGSRVILGGFKDNKDIDKYIGIEYDLIAIEEINQLTEEKVEKLRGSLRTSKPNWRPRLYASFNPGGIGHGFVKKTFVEPFLREIEGNTRFFPSTYRDNPFINTEYQQYLENLQGQLGQAWRDGDFDIMAGQFFTSFDEDLHVIDPYDIPTHWRRICCLDYGYTAPSALYWSAIAPSGQIVIYRELYITQHDYISLADEFIRLTPPNEKIDYLVADPACWNKNGASVGGLSGIDLFSARVHERWRDRDVETGQRSLSIVSGNNDRVQGWNIFRQKLRPSVTEGNLTTGLVIFDTCYDLVRTIPLMVHNDTGNPEDLNSDLEDHGVDSIRYLLMSEPLPKKTNGQLNSENFKRAMMRKKNPSLFRKKKLGWG